MNFKKYHVSRNLWSGDVPKYVYVKDYKKYNPDNAIALKAGTYTISSDGKLPIIQIFDENHTQLNVDDTITHTTGYYKMWDGLAIGPQSGAIHEITITLLSDYILTLTVPDNLGTYIMLNTGSEALPYEPYSSEVWHDTPHYIHNTSTDTITTLPAVIYPNAATATVGLKGQTVQSGTPSPDNPIMPQGCGERTENLWNEEGFSARAIISTHEHTDTNSYGTTLSTTIGKETIITQSEYPTGTVGYQNGFFFIDVDFSKYEIGDKVTLSFDYICNEVHSIEDQVTTVLYAGKNNNGIPVVLSSGKWSVSGRLTAVITIIADMNPYVEVRLCGNSITVKNIMLNAGSIALPYEPYGFQISISSASITTPFYLGEVETTRKIGKIDLGTLNWSKTASGNFYADTAILDCRIIGNTIIGNAICSDFFEVSGNNVANTPYSFSSCLNSQARPFVNSTGFEGMTGAEFKEAMSGVYMYYVLASETTGIINEPLMKIGDYADTLSNISIPVTAGGDTISVDTTVQPSEVTISYKGWHPITNTHEKSKNLFDYTITQGSFAIETGNEQASPYRVRTNMPNFMLPAGTYTINVDGADDIVIYCYDDNGYVQSASFTGWAPTPRKFTLNSSLYVRFAFRFGNNAAISPSNINYVMLNSGSTALPYEPYWT